ncbi:J domain-containing protein [Caenimonas aquaedulcis]|uniref:J domain-containing protein n=1 Tax=Caenimonas aquaedulcis TaxID=2793270 RepID=A0A931H5K1_9BURK|nr:J domain-containing protein [Caenimonas aquaedulcis]MBG9389050.1 J domain-containing protein [Caenimonas aquaedulcis]
MRPDPSARLDAIRTALLDYHRSPGKYSLARRQPSLLYAAIHDVLQLAAGRSPASAAAAPPALPLRQAACFFVRCAMLYPDADHYTLLGLEHDASPEQVKDHYRLMMRLTHPDFASDVGGAAWPHDAATRVNRAYEVLSSPVERAAYDDTIEPFPATKPAGLDAPTSPGRLRPAPGNAPRRRRAEDNRRDLRRLSAVFGTAGGAALIVAAVANLQPDKESLVQRAAASVRSRASNVLQASLTVPAEGAGAETAAPAAPALQLSAVTPPAPPTAGAAPLAALPSPSAPPPPPAAERESPATAPSAARTAASAAVEVAVAIAAPPYTGPTLTDVHPLLSRLLQEIESGRGERMMGLVDRDARNAPAAQALLQHYNHLVDGMRPLKVSNVQFDAQPRDGRLLVTGRLTVQSRGEPIAPRDFSVQAEFASREGGVVMTRLARAPE